MKFFSLLKTSNVRSSSSSSSWAWPSCHQPKTLSFRQYTTTTTTAAATNKNKSKNDIIEDVVLEATESFFTESLHSASLSFSTVSEESRLGVDPIETVIRGLRSDRLFFEPDETSSILEVKLTMNCNSYLPFKNSVVLSMDSKDPCADFRRSMAEMVETHGVGDWETLEDLLCWYLKVNGKSNHVHIVNAFVDLLFEIANASSDEEEELSPPPSPSSEIYKSSLSFSSVYCFDGEEDEEEIIPEDEAASSNT